MTNNFLATSLAHEHIISWFRQVRRPFPWRDPSTSGWGVLVSEVMSQQTPMTRVEPVWREWMHRWPTPADLAIESSTEVVRAWGKLGYPRRALRLHECAQIIARDHHNRVPSQVEILLTLPGIGPYTARAVACFAYGHNVPVVDTNVRRVVARVHHGYPEQSRPRAKQDLEEVAALLPQKSSEGAEFSAALMEFGALMCTSRAPRCEECFIAEECSWRQLGQPEWDEEIHGPRPTPQKFTGTDRQVRGLLMDVVRAHPGGVVKSALDEVWPDSVQRERALQSLLNDGLMSSDAGLYGLAGEF